jgi:hypothetical protein
VVSLVLCMLAAHFYQSPGTKNHVEILCAPRFLPWGPPIHETFLNKSNSSAQALRALLAMRC